MEEEKRFFKLKERLMCAAEFVRDGSKIADIGTDHAFLPIWLAQNKRISYAIASDVRVGPYNSAKENIKKYGVEQIVEARLGNGLSTVFADEAEDILICGMGGELIADILNDCPYIKNGKYRLILQPMSRPEALRKYLVKNGFKIETEKCVYDSNHYYTVISAYYTGVKAEKISESYYYMGEILKNPDSAAREYLLIGHNRIQNIIKGFSLSGDKEQIEIYTQIDKEILSAAEKCH